MSINHFTSHIFQLFHSTNWQNGVSIYRSGGVRLFQSYEDLCSAKVRTGIGENYDVRIKLHRTGRLIQWMECTCQANRRKGEKCQHLASFLIYLSAEKAEYLEKMGIEIGNIDEFLYKTQNDFLTGEANPKNTLDYAPDAKNTLTKHELPLFQNTIAQKNLKLISVASDEEVPWILAKFKTEENSLIPYRLNIDDACWLFFNSGFQYSLDDSLKAKVEHGFIGKRIFEVVGVEEGFHIYRSIAILDEKKGQTIDLSKFLKLIDIPDKQIGKAGFFCDEIGYIPFDDQSTLLQINRWKEYPKYAKVTGDQAASILDSDFSRLKECAAVILDDNASKLKVIDKLVSPEVFISKSIFGEYSLEIKENAKKVEGSDNIILSILKARAQGKKYLKSEEGFLKLTDDFDWLKDKFDKEGKLNLSTSEFVKFHEQIPEEAKFLGNTNALHTLREGLVSRENLSLPVFSCDFLNLRPYQEEGLKWLWWLYSNGLGGLLADEMGLGKTHQAMGLMLAVAQTKSRPIFLVVCPKTVIDHWLDKIRNFAPSVKTICYHGTHRKLYLKELQNNDVPIALVTSYGIMLRDIDFLSKFAWELSILDEAHLVKNQASRTYKAAMKLKSSMRLCLTGTPLENDLIELKNLYDFIIPGYLGSDSAFKRKFIQQKNSLSDLTLYRLIHPFKLRRNKSEVLTDLPEKVEDIRYCHLNSVQKELYEQALNLKGSKIIADLMDEKEPVSYVHVFSLISLLKQICNDPGLVDERFINSGSGKLEVFQEILQEIIENNHKVVVFSQYAKMIHKLSSRLRSQGVLHCVLTGQSQNRGKIVSDFQNDENIKVFLCSLLAGGTGIDLTSASVVIHFDRWWNSAKEDQATDRVHRIGQSKNVQVYKLVTKGTLEEKINEIISRKKVLFDQFVKQDEEVFKSLSREDLLNILKLPGENSNFMFSEED